MNCPKCGGTLSVIDGVYNPDDNEYYRLRKCSKCGNKIRTVEMFADFDQLSQDWNKYYRTSKRRK